MTITEERRSIDYGRIQDQILIVERTSNECHVMIGDGHEQARKARLHSELQALTRILVEEVAGALVREVLEASTTLLRDAMRAAAPEDLVRIARSDNGDLALHALHNLGMTPAEFQQEYMGEPGLELACAACGKPRSHHEGALELCPGTDTMFVTQQQVDDATPYEGPGICDGCGEMKTDVQEIPSDGVQVGACLCRSCRTPDPATATPAEIASIAEHARRRPPG